ncbi:MAG: hypothetical protein JSW26_23355 [Desulfobacterales bacterium]|nr:MAG: hypothetical protein JSW26_23355 [Desulfobacterales bacterium]
MFRKDSLNRWLPASRSKKKRRDPGIPFGAGRGRRWLGIVILLAVALAWFVPASQAQTVTVEITGNAVPGADLTATASIDGGLTIESVLWEQTGGAAAAIPLPGANPTTVTLGAESLFKAELIHVVSEPPIGPDQLPPNVPPPPGEFPAGLQNRFQVVAINPFALEEAGKVTLKATVTTSSGDYEGEAEIHVLLPWKVKADIGNHALGIPVLLHGKDQATYNWTLSRRPWNSSATLMDGTSQNPELTPDITGQYTLAVTDLAEDRTVTVDVYAGTWQGIITGQDMDGRPLAGNCRRCHREGGRAPDIFTPWAQTGHAEIFTVNLNTSTHYGESCFACHTVGFDLDVDNYGVDDVGDYMGFLNSGLLNNPSDPPDNLPWTTMLADFPIVARHANAQCENCHGPQSTLAHNARALRSRTAVMGTDPRANISAGVCAVCHGEPLRHARFQQWQLSKHADYELAIEEGESGTCSRCHTGNGFLSWIPALVDDDPTNDNENVIVTWTEDAIHPQTCATCHDPHRIGTASGDNNNATVRISDATPLLAAGFKAPATATGNSVGRGALCMTCHNSRRGLRNDGVPLTDPTRAPHGPTQADVLMGQSAYLVALGENDPYPPGQPGSHATRTNPETEGERALVDTCTTCHMAKTPPPADLSYNQGGTNHTFFASTSICIECHPGLNPEFIQGPVSDQLSELKTLIEAAIRVLIEQQIAAGNRVDLGGQATITDAAVIDEIVFGDSRGRQAITVNFTDATSVGPVGMNSVRVLDADGNNLGLLYGFTDESLPKAGWNYLLINNDGSRGVHNYLFVVNVLSTSINALEPPAGP